jgi:hypothetical protein
MKPKQPAVTGHCYTHPAARSSRSKPAASAVTSSLVAGFERAAHEGLIVRWSINPPVARRAWRAMRLRPEQPAPPTDALEHALEHEQDSLSDWQGASTAGRDLQIVATIGRPCTSR